MSNQNITEGDIVRYVVEDGGLDTARVRRVYDDHVQLVNQEHGYQSIGQDQILEIIGEVQPSTTGKKSS
ncbi:hypothetical protein [Tengunoibacter tsumagoiensis]|uniref:Uncharacterized protein n=1 Tax=Tengunoibacter tsumagoiensis TaxID=2014871 RepID=A0A402A8M9_9CHLR|nr:hypothetical protein [Tengunoibacter tsumagoiensis]GCE15311.1 hypothetical protein KTT_51700 [Tengunoibacter tsumagoiensis]